MKYFLKVLFIIRYYGLYKNDIFVHPFSILGTQTYIGKGTNINGRCYIKSAKNAKVVIGKYCAIAHNLRIRTRNHNVNYPNVQDKFQNLYGFKDLTITKGDIVIGNNCWIGDNVIILPGVHIGNGAVIGAGSIVTKNIPDYAVAGGNPAKIIKMRFCESIIKELLEIKWWNWNNDKIKKNKVFFNTDLVADNVCLSNLVK